MLNESPFDPTANSLDLIDSTYQEGVIKVLCKARNNVLAELELHKKSGPEGLGFLAQWRQYSNLSPLRVIGTNVEQKDVTKPEILMQIAADIGIDAKLFLRVYESDEAKKQISIHFNKVRQWGIHSFPTVIVQNAAGYS